MKDRLQNVNRCAIADNGLPEQLMNFEDMIMEHSSKYYIDEKGIQREKNPPSLWNLFLDAI